MRRILSFTLFVILTFGIVGAVSQPHPAVAATQSLADLMPADVAFYVDVKTANFDKTVGSLTGLLSKAGIPIPANLYADVDKGLTQLLGHPASFQKDVLSWLGDHVAIGVLISDTMLNTPSNAQTLAAVQPEALAILTVKDEAAANSYLKAILAALEKQGLKFTSTDDKLNDKAATLYTNGLAKLSILRTPGYVVIGSGSSVKSMLAALNSKQPTLGMDAKYQKVIGLLKPDNGLTAYVGQRLFQYQLKTLQRVQQQLSNASTDINTPEANTTPTAVATNSQQTALLEAYKVIDGVAMAARAEGKVLALDFAFAMNPDAAKKYAELLGLPINTLSQSMQPLSGKLIGQIPSNTFALIYGSNLAQIYTQLKEQIIALSKLSANLDRSPGLNVDQAEEGFTQLENGLRDNLYIDLKADVLSWMGGEYALYMTYNKTGDLAVASKGQWPFDNTLLIAATDTKKANSFIDKLNTALRTDVGIVPVKMGDNLFAISANSPVRVGYGVTGDTFILSTGTGIVPSSAAVKGGDSLTSSTPWKNASALLPKNYTQLLYVDLAPVYNYAKAAQAEWAKSQSASQKQDTERALAFLNEFESALIYTSVVDPSSAVSTFALILK